jgi:hypothetical protein
MWAMQEEELRRRDEARAYLMQMVMNGRQEQLQEREIARKAETRVEEEYALKVYRETMDALEHERQEEVQRGQV